MITTTMPRTLYEAEHEGFRAAFRTFLDNEAVPFAEAWEQAGFVDREFIAKAGRLGFLAFEAPQRFGGLGVHDYRYNAVIAEETAYSGTAGDTFSMHNDIITPYLLDLTSEEQRARWLPGFTAGTTVAALALTEPGAGSDLAAIRTTARLDGDAYVVNGAKTFITNGASADLIITLTRTGEHDGRGTSLIVVERDTPGLTRGSPLRKVGHRAQDTAELFFDNCRVPVGNLIGVAGRGLSSTLRNLPRERLSIATTAVASAERAFALAVDHTRDRKAFSGRLIDLPTVGSTLAEIRTELAVARTYIDACVLAINAGRLSPEEAAGAKYWTTDLQFCVIDRCVQLFGGYGYMEEYAIARMWRDSRVQRIYGGANEVMKSVVAKAISR